MRRTNLLLLAGIFLFLGCTETEKRGGEPSEKAETDAPEKARVSKKIEREIPVEQDFFQITNISNTTVDFTMGDFNVWIEGDSAQVSHVSFDFDGGILTITTPLDVNNDITNFPSGSDVVVHVSCPDLRTMAICAGGGFICRETLKTDYFQLGGMVGGSIAIDSISCDRFRYDSNGNTALHIGGVGSRESVVITTGGGTLDLSLDASESCYLDVKGGSTVNMRVNTPKLESMIETKGAVNLTMDTQELLLDALAGNISLSGHAGRPKIRKGKLAIVSDGMK